MHHGPGDPEVLAGQRLHPLEVVLAQRDEDGAERLVLDAVAGRHHVAAVDQHAAALALADADLERGEGGKGVVPEGHVGGECSVQFRLIYKLFDHVSIAM